MKWKPGSTYSQYLPITSVLSSWEDEEQAVNVGIETRINSRRMRNSEGMRSEDNHQTQMIPNAGEELLIREAGTVKITLIQWNIHLNNLPRVKAILSSKEDGHDCSSSPLWMKDGVDNSINGTRDQLSSGCEHSLSGLWKAAGIWGRSRFYFHDNEHRLVSSRRWSFFTRPKLWTTFARYITAGGT